MPRPLGSKNKPKFVRQYEDLPDIITPNELAKWWRTNRSEIMRQLREGEIPKDCYFMSPGGCHYRLVKRKLALLKGIIPSPDAA